MQGECPHCHKKIGRVCAEGVALGDLNSEENIVHQEIQWTGFNCPECGQEIVEGATGTGEVYEAVWGPPNS